MIAESLSRLKTNLEECGLTSLSNWIDSILVETARGRDGGVIVHPLAAVHGPVVVAVIVDICVSVKHQPVLTNLLSQSSCNFMTIS